VFLNTGSDLAPNVSPYALSKYQFAQWGRTMVSANPGADSGLQFINVLLQHMYGPGDDPSKFTTHVMRACHANQERLQLTAGEQQRDFIFIDDVVSAYETLLQRASQLAAYDEIDVGSGEAPSVRSFVETVHQLTASTTHLDFGAQPYRPNEAMLCQADTTRLRGLGWQPLYSLQAGLKKTLEQEFQS
jgi:nucleoside-diphosphate-sugar epimerase